MKSVEDRNPPIIGFDGNHRVGKGTQIELLRISLADQGIRSIILRGDGSRPGLGGSERDPYSTWWQNFKNYVNESDDEYRVWRIGARRLLGEAAARLVSIDDHEETVLLFDRARVSRTQMTLKEGLPVDFETMYCNESNDTYNDDKLRQLRPDLTIYMHAPTSTLLRRLSPGDPKYEFRRNNIIHSQETFDNAFESCRDRGEDVEAVNANQDPINITLAIRNAIMARRLLNLKR
jgi:thymidylate kinase